MHAPKEPMISHRAQDAGSLLPRVAAQPFGAALDVMPVVVLMGARQTGKSTLAQSHPALRDHVYVTLDDLSVLAQAREDPDGLVRRAPRLVLDEVQRAPDILIALKRAVDEGGNGPGRYVLTGSANLLLMPRIQESLAGRASYVPVGPMTRREQLGLGRAGRWSDFLGHPVDAWYDLAMSLDGEPADWGELARRGGYPPPALQLTEDAQRDIWFAGYV